ncbi:MAG: response regulator [Euryarchaeota archaeon]|nr:response regulator [Euryarchaeota archaeon]
MTEPTPEEKEWNVLVVEDNPDHGWMLQKTISTGLPANVKVVRTAREAKAEIETEEYDVMVLDNRLPDGEGARLVDEIRKSGYKGILLLVTAQASEEVLSVALEAGATDYILKSRGYQDRVLEEILERLGETR